MLLCRDLNQTDLICITFTLQLAKVEKLKPMELELKKLEDLSEAIVNDFAYMRAREEEMRDTNGRFLFVHLFICIL